MISYQFDLTFSELIKLLFYKKLCPTCGGKLQRKTEKKYIKTGWDSMNGTTYYADQYRLRFYYVCKPCNHNVELHEIGRKKQLNEKDPS